jgi:hypothetical protein
MPWKSKTLALSLAVLIAWGILSTAPGTAMAQGLNRTPVAVGTKIADGQAYPTLVELKHQPDPRKQWPPSARLRGKRF